MIRPERRIFLDPDGTWPPGWLFVVVEGPTGVRYAQQCGGVGCDERDVEGYLVPLGGQLDTAELTRLFHFGRSCPAGGLLPGREQRLRELVAGIPYWVSGAPGQADTVVHLDLDEARMGEVTEAWVPVTTPDGPGVLMWYNCD